MIRPVEFAGTWYPGDSEKCKSQIEDFLERKKPCDVDILKIGGIVPHAGWFFSGKIACNVISCLKGKEVDTIIIFGKHTTPFGGNSIMASGEWETPLGNLKIDSEFAEELCEEFHFKVETPTHYEPDNTIELQLPFIKYHFPDAKILPLGIVRAESKSLEIGSRVVEIARELGRKIKIIGSTDLTHYGPNYGFTPKGVGEEALEWVKANDKRMIDLFLAMEPEEILKEAGRNSNCCCPAAVATAITALKNAGATKGHLIDYYTSYDIHPDYSFVGYAGVIY